MREYLHKNHMLKALSGLFRRNVFFMINFQGLFYEIFIQNKLKSNYLFVPDISEKINRLFCEILMNK